MFSQNVCIFSFQEYGNIVENFLSFNLSLSLFVCLFVCVVCWRLKCSLSCEQEIFKFLVCMITKILAANILKYILKCVNSSVFVTEMACDKTNFKHTFRFGESEIGRTSGIWKFPEPTSLRSVSSGNFQPPSVRAI